MKRFLIKKMSLANKINRKSLWLEGSKKKNMIRSIRSEAHSSP